MSTLTTQTTSYTSPGEAIHSGVKGKDKILSIQYLRGIAAILVVLFHSTALIGPDWKDFLKNGMVGVDVFFIMSGFIIYYITTNRSELTPKNFITKRVLRIFPPFFIVWLIVSCVSYQNAPFVNVIKSLFLFHVDYNSSAPAYKFNMIGPAWTLSYEIYFYGLFCVAGLMSHKYRGLICSLFLLLIPVALQLYFNNSFSYAANIKAEFILTSLLQSPLKILSNAMLWEFIGGILLAYIFMNYRSKLNNFNKSIRWALALALIGIFIYQIFFSIAHAQGIGGLFWPSMCLVAGALVAEDLIHINIKPLSFLGDISYSLYLVHWSTIKVIVTYYPGSWNNQYGIMGLISYLALAIFISYLLYKFIEKPSIKIARKLLS